MKEKKRRWGGNWREVYTWEKRLWRVTGGRSCFLVVPLVRAAGARERSKSLGNIRSKGSKYVQMCALNKWGLCPLFFLLFNRIHDKLFFFFYLQGLDDGGPPCLGKNLFSHSEKECEVK